MVHLPFDSPSGCSQLVVGRDTLVVSDGCGISKCAIPRPVQQVNSNQL